MNKKVINDLFDYLHMKIVQDENNFKFSLDSILLAEFVEKPKKDDIMLDMCTGNAPIPLILSTKYQNKIYGFELQKEIYELAIESVYINNCVEQIEIINADIKNVKNYFPGNNFDIITCNPPYFKTTKDSLKNENMVKAIARHEITVDLDTVIKLASDNLKNKGQFYLVHRAERLDEIIELSLKHHLAVKKIELVCTKDDENPNIVLIKAVKNGSNGVKLHVIKNIKNYKSYQGIFN